jgi:hypothetical protein
MTYRIVPRTSIGLPAIVTGSTGAPRPRVHNARWYTFHYTGNNVTYRGRDGAEIVRQIQRVFEASKPFEYSYCIDQNDDDRIFEFAGKFAAAHSAGENFDSIGVLFINGVKEPLTPTQILKAQWLRDVLKVDGTLRAAVDQRPHRWMPGAATACPGDLIMPSLPQLVKPYEDPGRYDPEAGKWGLWPVAPKRNLHEGDVGPDVQYLNDALRLTRGESKVCGDIYNAHTTRAVCRLQGDAGKAQVGEEAGFVGPKTWKVIDWHTSR